MSSLSKISVAILAGGLGTRLSKTLPGRQKVVAKVIEKPFVEYILDQLSKAGFRKIVLCTGHLGNQVKKAFWKKYKKIDLLYSKEQRPLGTAGALRNAFPLLISETILVMNGDSFFDIDFNKFWKFHVRKKSNASLALKWMSDTSSSGRVDSSNDGSIISFQEKEKGSGEGLINGGIYLINRDFIAEIPKGQEISIEKDIFPNWVGRGFYGFESKGKFIDIGTPENYNKAEEFFSK